MRLDLRKTAQRIGDRRYWISISFDREKYPTDAMILDEAVAQIISEECDNFVLDYESEVDDRLFSMYRIYNREEWISSTGRIYATLGWNEIPCFLESWAEEYTETSEWLDAQDTASCSWKFNDYELSLTDLSDAPSKPPGYYYPDVDELMVDED